MARCRRRGKRRGTLARQVGPARCSRGPNVYRILWKREKQSEVSFETFKTVTEATRHARAELANKNAHGFEIVWAGSGRRLQDWYRQACLERGE